MREQDETFAAPVAGKPTLIRVRRPTAADLAACEAATRRGYRRAVRRGSMTRAQFLAAAERRGIWTPAHQARYDELARRLAADEELLHEASAEEARAAAVRMRTTRCEIRRLKQPYWTLERTTADGRAVEAGFDALAARCTTFARTGRPVFGGVRDYRRQAGTPVHRLASEAMARLWLGLRPSDEYERAPPEERYLAQFRPATAVA